jgi:uncharacterized protein
MEEKIVFSSGKLALEGLFSKGRSGSAVVVTHPHPHYGGDMLSPVVEAVARAYAGAGFATLRFNFRGTGASQGSFDNGIGEQDDVHAALDFLRSNGNGSVDLAGYSFGAWVNALACPDRPATGRMVMVAPPVNFLDFDPVVSLPALALVIAGDRDEFGSADRTRTMVSNWNAGAALEVISGADHFFWGYLDRVEAIIADFLR